jgi:hypothetical protein
MEGEKMEGSCRGGMEHGVYEGHHDQMHGDKMAMMGGMMKCLFKDAKMELMKEKVKKKIEAAEGKKLDAMADLLVSGMLEHMKEKMEMWKKKQEMMEKMKALFMEE